MSGKGWAPFFDWWDEVAEGDRITAEFGDVPVVALAPFAGAVGIYRPPGPKDWTPRPERREFHGLMAVPRSEPIRVRIRRADGNGVLSPLTNWHRLRAAYPGVLGVLKAGSRFRMFGNISSSV